MDRAGTSFPACRSVSFVSAEKTLQLKTVLLVDTFDDSRILVRWFLGNFGYIVDSVRSAEEALAVFDPSIHDLVVTDYLMSGMTGVEMAHVIKLRSPSTPVIMCSPSEPKDQTCLDAIIPKGNRTVFQHEMLRMKETMDFLLSLEFLLERV